MILDALAESARKRVAEAAKWRSLEEIRRQALSLPPKAAPFAFERVLRGKRLSFICEVKKASPSKGVIAEHFPYLEIAEEYEKAGWKEIRVGLAPQDGPMILKTYHYNPKDPAYEGMTQDELRAHFSEKLREEQAEGRKRRRPSGTRAAECFRRRRKRRGSGE